MDGQYSHFGFVMGCTLLASSLAGCGGSSRDSASSAAEGGTDSLFGASRGGASQTAASQTGTSQAGNSPSGTSGVAGPVAPYVCDTDSITPDQGAAPLPLIGAYLGTYQVTSTTDNATTCPNPWRDPLVTTEYVLLGSDGDRDIRVYPCTTATECSKNTISAWYSGAISREAGAGLSGWYLTSGKTDPTTKECSDLYVFRYIVATNAGTTLQERIRLTTCGSNFGQDARPGDMVPCECVSQSYELSRIR